MPGLVDDTVLDAFAVTGEPHTVAAELTRRYGRLFTRCVLHTSYDPGPNVLAEIADAIRSGHGSLGNCPAGAAS